MLKIVRNDIVHMETEAIVNPANPMPIIGAGCETAIYHAAGKEALLAARQSVGELREGQAAITPGFGLPAKYIIHAVSPFYYGDTERAEELLRNCYRESFRLVEENKIQSIAFPVLGTGSYGYPREEGFAIACEEIRTFLEQHDICVYLVVFDSAMFLQGQKETADLESYIDSHYVEMAARQEYGEDIPFRASEAGMQMQSDIREEARKNARAERDRRNALPRPSFGKIFLNSSSSKRGNKAGAKPADTVPEITEEKCEAAEPTYADAQMDSFAGAGAFEEIHGKKLEERMRHRSDTFSEYLLYLIESKGMTNAEVYKRALVDKKVFSKIKNNPDYHTQKITALCLCVGARLNLDETRDLLARAGYALSPCDRTDIIFSFFIENRIYDMIELDIQLEEHGLPCLIC